MCVCVRETVNEWFSAACGSAKFRCIHDFFCVCAHAWPLKDHALALLHPRVSSHQLRVQERIFTNTPLDPLHQPMKKENDQKHTLSKNLILEARRECVCVCVWLTRWQWWRISLCWLPADTEGFPLLSSSVEHLTPPWCYCSSHTHTHKRGSLTWVTDTAQMSHQNFHPVMEYYSITQVVKIYLNCNFVLL